MLQPARPGAQRVPATSDASPSSIRQALVLDADFPDRVISAGGTEARFSLPDGRSAGGTIQQLERDDAGVVSVGGTLKEPAAGHFFFQRQTAPGTAGAIVGNVRLDGSITAWRVDPAGPQGEPVLTEVRLDQVICVGQPLPESASDSPAPPSGSASSPANSPQLAPQAHPSDIADPAVLNGVIPLQSLPGATGVIYLDFDGEPGPFTGWSMVKRDAAPAGATNSQIKEIWQRVAEDFQSFNLNITTDRRIFDNAPENSRQHVIITPTNDASPGAGGVAFTGSFDWTGNTVCWCFIRTGKNAAEAISHEVGHTLGLSHDGRTSPVEEYYAGHGSGETGWAPIMGTGYSKNLTQWSRGEYLESDNKEEDLSIIATNNNNVDFRSDDTSTAYATADYLDIFPDFTVSNEGILETPGDVDAWRFQTDGGPVSFTVATVSTGPNTDLLAEIHTADNIPVASANPDTTLGTTLATTLAAGSYTLRISGTGRGDPIATGYPAYGSLGAYLISGSVTNGVRHDRFAVDENAPDGTALGTVAPRLAHGANPLNYSIASGNTGSILAIDSATGLLTVANTEALDYEALSRQWDDPADLELFVTITDSLDPLLTESLRVVVTVNPLNEPPVAVGGSTTIFTRTPAGVPVFQVTGSDPDRFDFPHFSIAAGNTGGAFTIDPISGWLTSTTAFPSVAPATPFTLTVRATDRGTPALTRDATVTLAILETPSGYTPGGWMRTWFEGINGNTVSSLTNHPKFINNTPDSEELQHIADTGRHGTNYGSTARAWLIPPFTGTYQFWITSDDASELRLGTHAAPGSATVRASASGPTGRYQYNRYSTQQSGPVALTAGIPYYFEVRHKQANGPDHLVVAWEGPGFSRRVLTGAHLAPYRQDYPPRIPPQTFPVRRGSDFGTSPGTVAATDANTGDRPGSFAITGGTAASWCAIDAATGLLYISDPAALDSATANPSTLMVAVSDNGTPPLSATGTVTLQLLTPSAIRGGGLVQQVWTDLFPGSLATLTADPRYPNSPSSTRMLSGFDPVTGGPGENYGSRIRAWVTPPATGLYTFYLAGDDEAQLRFTTGIDHATAPVVASLATPVARNAWTRFPSQKSGAFSLTAGRKYYLETLQANGTGADFVQVGWTGPGLSSPAVIPAMALEAFDFNTAPEWSAGPYHFTIKPNTPAGSPAGTVSAADPDGSGLVYTITGGNSSGAFLLNPFTGLISVANPAALTPGSSFVLSLRVQDNGVDGTFPCRTANTTATLTVPPDFAAVRPAVRTVNLPAGLGLEFETTPSGRAAATVAWTQLSGPGSVSFDDAKAWNTGARFSVPGLYVIRGTETAGGLPLQLDFTIQSGRAPALPGGDRIGHQLSLPTHTWDDGTWQISSGGRGFTRGPRDSGYFINQPAAPDAVITARIFSVDNLSGHDSIAGVMIRQSNAADARSFFCGITSLHGRRLILRSTAGLSAITAAEENPPVTAFTPVWVKLVRSGMVFTAFTAPDFAGTPGPFTPLGQPWTIPMNGPCLIGLAATSGISGAPGSAVIDHLTVSPSLLNLGPDLSAGAPTAIMFPSSALLTGTINDDTRPALPGGTFPLWKKVSGPGSVTFDNPSSLNPTASFGSPGDYQLRLTADDGEIRSFRDLTLTVAASPLELWRLTSFPGTTGDPLITGDTADPDGDHLPNLVEYALGLPPLTPDRDPLIFTTVRIGDATYLRLTISRNPAATDVQTFIETSPAPAVPGSWNTVPLVIETDTPNILSVRTALPVNALPVQFLRLKAIR